MQTTTRSSLVRRARPNEFAEASDSKKGGHLIPGILLLVWCARPAVAAVRGGIAIGRQHAVRLSVRACTVGMRAPHHWRDSAAHQSRYQRSSNPATDRSPWRRLLCSALTTPGRCARRRDLVSTDATVSRSRPSVSVPSQGVEGTLPFAVPHRTASSGIGHGDRSERTLLRHSSAAHLCRGNAWYGGSVRAVEALAGGDRRRSGVPEGCSR